MGALVRLGCWARWVRAVAGFVLALGAGAHAETLTVAVPEVPAVIDPQRAVTKTELAIMPLIFTGLVARDASGTLVPGIAESWTVDSDERAYIFTLRRGLTWSDGRALDADDVVAGIERALDPATGAPAIARLLPIRNAADYMLGTLSERASLGVTAPDSRTVRFDLAAPSAHFLDVLAEPIAMPVPRHRRDALQDAWTQPFVVVGNGPFDPVPAGDTWALKPNPRFRGPETFAAERIEWRAAASADAAMSAISTGEVQAMLGFDLLPARGRGEGLTVTTRVVVNVSRTPLDRREVRHALAMAIDRTAMIDALELRDAQPAYSLIPYDLTGGYGGPRAPYAKLDQDDRVTVAGALLLDLTDAQIDLRLAVPEGDPHGEIADRIAADLAPLGFKIAVVAEPAAAHERRLLAGDFDLAIAADAPRDPYHYLFAFSQTALPWNLGRYSDVGFDDNLAASDAAREPTWRIEKLRAADEILTQDQAVWPLFTAKPDAGFAARALSVFPARPTTRKPR